MELNPLIVTPDRERVYQLDKIHQDLREELRRMLSAFLADTTEDNPYECDIELERYAQSVYNPHVTAMYQAEDGIIWLKWDGEDDFSSDFYDLSTDEQICVLEEII